MEKELRGTLYKKNEHYYARVYYYVEGKRKSKDYKTGIEVGSPSTRKGKQNERLANQKLAELLANFRIPGVINVEDLKEQMLTETLTNWLEYQKGARSASTIAGYQWAANDLLLYFGEIAPVRTVDLTSEMVERYQNWERMRRSPGYKGEHKKKTMYSDGSGIENTVKHRTTMLRSVLQYAKRAGMVDRNVASNRDSYVDFPNPQRHEFQVLTPEEAQKMLECLEHEELWFKVVVILALLFGLRRSEIIGIRICDIDITQGIIRISHAVTQQTIDNKNVLSANPFTKNKKAKEFELEQYLIRILNELIRDQKKNEQVFGKSYDRTWDGYLFRHVDGKLIFPNMVTSKFRNFLKKNGLKQIRFHDLRHSCASILYANGTDLLTIQEILGHAQLTTTIMYTHKLSDRKNSALVKMGSLVLPDAQKSEVTES